MLSKIVQTLMEEKLRIKFLEGDHLYLRPLEDKDVDGPYLAWLNDEIVCCGNSHHVYPYTRRQALDYIQRSGEAVKELTLAIVLKEGDRHIGNIALQRIHSIYRSADLSILLGDKEQWGKGYGLEAARLVLHHGFSALNLMRIACATFEKNIAMRKLAIALGMHEEGVRRRAAYKDGEFQDVVEFGILREEFEQQHPGGTTCLITPHES